MKRRRSKKREGWRGEGQSIFEGFMQEIPVVESINFKITKNRGRKGKK